MNMTKNPTPNALSELLRRCDDEAADYVVMVDNDGEVHIERDPPEPDYTRVRFYLEGFLHGNGEAGPTAAADTVGVQNLFDAIDRTWKSGETGQVDGALPS